MTSSLQRFGITLALLSLASIVSSKVGAQPPDYLLQWGSFGSGDGQFSFPQGVATDAAGNIYVADSLNHRIQKFGDSSTPTAATSWGRVKSLFR